MNFPWFKTVDRVILRIFAAVLIMWFILVFTVILEGILVNNTVRDKRIQIMLRFVYSIAHFFGRFRFLSVTFGNLCG